jgi:L-aspartate oxidase
LHKSHVLIIGCGIAGATAALQLARNPQLTITLVTRETDPHESNTCYAQGGIIGGGLDDSAETLIADILAAGAGTSSPPIARILAEDGPRLLNEILVEMAGVSFDRNADGAFNWGKAGAHSRRRILHVGDGTGQAIINGLITALHKCPNVTIVTDVTAVDLITFPHHSCDPQTIDQPIACHGAYLFDRQKHTVHRYLAPVTVLATGGLGRIYRYTTNPPGARGDGLALAHRAGAHIVNAEYVQFHPTALAVPGAEGYLICEHMRGEGGILLTPEGHAFMADYSPEWKDLAPRDVVARAIHNEMEKHGYPYVLLDIASRMPADAIIARFPNNYAECLRVGVDITREPIPVMPAAHFSCGGVEVDEWGRTSIEKLYAIGEVSCTGLHGANRLAATSLLEGLVWGCRVGQQIEQVLDHNPTIPASDQVPPWEMDGLVKEPDPARILGDMQTIKNIMWRSVGLVRNANRLSQAVQELRHLENEIKTFYCTTCLSDELIGLRNAVEVALMVTLAAQNNRQSRGCHYREDSIQ